MSHVRIQVAFNDGTEMEVTEEFYGADNDIYKARESRTAMLVGMAKLDNAIAGMYGDVDRREAP